MDATVPWAVWVGLIEPFYFDGKKGHKPKPLETMLRMYLLQALREDVAELPGGPG